MKKIFKEEFEAPNPIPTNYYHETYGEYQLLKLTADQKGPNEAGFRIVSNYAELIHVIEKTNDIAGILNIEGAHALLSLPRWDTHQKSWNKLTDEQKSDIKSIYLKNIANIKGKGFDLTKPKSPKNEGIFHPNHTPFYLTLAHMYNNFLVGHATSYSGMSAELFDQRMGLNEDISGLGHEVIKKLLTRGENERRILIDVKHMSLKSREQFYDLRRNYFKDVPIIFSHGAVTGLSKNNVPQPFESDSDYHKKRFLSSMSINLFDEDIETIIRSDGIIGLAPHEGRMPGGEAKRKINDIRKKYASQKRKNRLYKFYPEIKRFTLSYLCQIFFTSNEWQEVRDWMLGIIFV